MKAQAACKKTVAGHVLENVGLANAYTVKAAGNQIAPGVDIFPGVEHSD
jgi:hypothetical protein